MDLTGYWVAVVTEDWRYRMLTPDKGDFTGIALNGAGRAVMQKWDPAADQAGGEACRSYGAAAIMRTPTRLHITWQDGNTLKVETDAGQQTRLLHFGAAARTRCDTELAGLLNAPCGRACEDEAAVAASPPI